MKIKRSSLYVYLRIIKIKIHFFKSPDLHSRIKSDNCYYPRVQLIFSRRYYDAWIIERKSNNNNNYYYYYVNNHLACEWDYFSEGDAFDSRRGASRERVGAEPMATSCSCSASCISDRSAVARGNADALEPALHYVQFIVPWSTVIDIKNDSDITFELTKQTFAYRIVIGERRDEIHTNDRAFD